MRRCMWSVCIDVGVVEGRIEGVECECQCISLRFFDEVWRDR
jgi:hypothetical protein